MKIIIDDRIYIPKKVLDRDDLEKHFVKHLYDDKTCKKCEYKQGSGDCEACPAFLGSVRLFKERGKFYGFPQGLRSKLRSFVDFPDFDIDDRRPYPKFKHPIKFTGKLYDGTQQYQANQVKIASDWLKKKNGTICARPRTGKTPLSLYCAIQLGYKTLIIAHQQELLKQFEKRIRELTNVPKLERQLGKKIAGIITKPKDLKKYDIALATYQSFISERGQERVQEYINDSFGMIIIDEAHLCPANAFSKFVGSLNIPHRLALSATPERKDGKEFILYAQMGPIVATSKSAAMVPDIEIFETNIAPPRKYSMWVYAMQFLCKNEERNKMIVKQVFKHLREGRNILIATDFRNHVNTLVNMINHQAKVCNVKRGEKWPSQTAVPFMNGVDRDTTIKNISMGINRVTVAIRGMVKHGLDIPVWDTVYSTIPTNNKGLFYQLACRGCTPSKETKRPPLVLIFKDSMPQSIGCLRSLYSQEIMPGLYGSDVKYKMDNTNRTKCR